MPVRGKQKARDAPDKKIQQKIATSWTRLSSIQKTTLGLGIPASKAIALVLNRRDRESREERLTFVGEDDIKIEMQVPQEDVKLIIGRQGANIKQLRKQTGTRIDEDTENVGNERVLPISGVPVQVYKAKAAIHHFLGKKNTLVFKQLLVPQPSVGRIIGRRWPRICYVGKGCMEFKEILLLLPSGT